MIMESFSWRKPSDVVEEEKDAGQKQGEDWHVGECTPVLCTEMCP